MNAQAIDHDDREGDAYEPAHAHYAPYSAPTPEPRLGDTSPANTTMITPRAPRTVVCAVPRSATTSPTARGRPRERRRGTRRLGRGPFARRPASARRPESALGPRPAEQDDAACGQHGNERDAERQHDQAADHRTDQRAGAVEEADRRVGCQQLHQGERTNAGSRALITGRKQPSATPTTPAASSRPVVGPPDAATPAIANDPTAAIVPIRRSSTPCPRRQPRAVATGTPTVGARVRTIPYVATSAAPPHEKRNVDTTTSWARSTARATASRDLGVTHGTVGDHGAYRTQ